MIKKLDEEENTFLIGPFKEDEVKLTVWNCGDNKSPSPDDFNFKFIRKMWPVLKKDIMTFVDKFHQHGRILKGGYLSFVKLTQRNKSLATSKISTDFSNWLYVQNHGKATGEQIGESCWIGYF